jgi:hypothetical protein
MADSLIIAGSIELVGAGADGGPGVESALPLCPGAIFTVDTGFDMGSPQPIVDIVESLILNGERPYGTRASNRTITLPVSVTAPSRTLLSGALETLLQLIDQQTWTLTWTRDGSGLPLVLDCFRANPSKPAYNLTDAQQFYASITVEFQALPYGRSDIAQQLTFASPLAGTSAPPAPVTLDTFTSVAAIAQFSRSTQALVGTYSAEWNPDAAPAYDANGNNIPAPVYTQTISAKNITGMQAIGLWVGFGSNYTQFYHLSTDPVTYNFTLTDGSGNVLSFGTSTSNQNVSANPADPNWTYVTANIPQGQSFNYADVVAYSIEVQNYSSYYTGNLLVYLNLYLNDFQAIPVSASAVAGTRGSIYTLGGIIGTASAPLALQFTQATPSNTFKTLIAHRPGPDSPPSLLPLLTVGAGSDTPNGGTFYPVPSLVTGLNGVFGGTYSIMLVNETWNTPSASRTVTVTVYQYEQPGGSYVTASVSQTFVPSAFVTNGMLVMGELTLPINDIAPDNTDAYFEITVTDTNTSDRFLDCLFLDTMGQTVWANLAASSYVTYYIDAPDTDRDLGRVLGSTSGRAQATSVLASSFVSGGPLTVDPGSNVLLCYCIEGAPALAAYYYPAWYLDRLA